MYFQVKISGVTDKFTYTAYKDTHFFSKLVTDYLGDGDDIRPFYDYRPDKTGLADAIARRSEFPVDRQVLVSTLTRQYEGLKLSNASSENLRKLADQNTYTVCTAHQPNLMTGYLYFIYKILHAIKMASELNESHPGKHFVPVYYMGSEDNDLEELGVFRFRDTVFRWDGDGQKGAVGRMTTKSLKPLIQELFRNFGPPGKSCDDLMKMVTDAYLKQPTIGSATRYLVNELFGKYGLLVLDPDDAAFKKQYTSVMKDELLHQSSYPILQQQIDKLSVHYKIQAHPRELNLFYLDNGIRERIVFDNNQSRVNNTSLQFSREEILNELELHPERFSPNVMLRGMLQETILPNVAFIGGGAEVAYWMQLRTLFSHYNVFFPCIFLRQSVLWVGTRDEDTLSKIGLKLTDLFKPEEQLIRDYISNHSTTDWQTSAESDEIGRILERLKQKALAVDSTLEASTNATLTRMQAQLTKLEKKMLRAEKKKAAVQLNRIQTVRGKLFPGGSLQERTDNFLTYYLENGSDFLDVILTGIKPMDNQFLVVSA